MRVGQRWRESQVSLCCVLEVGKRMKLAFMHVSAGLVHQLTGSSDGSGSRGRAESVEDERWSLILHMWRLFPPSVFLKRKANWSRSLDSRPGAPGKHCLQPKHIV